MEYGMKRVMGFVFSMVLLLGLGGCVKTPTAKIDPTLENITNVKALTGLASIAFEWKPIGSSSRIDGINIYRSKTGASFEKIKKIKDRYATHFTDKDLTPNSNYSYRFSTYQNNGSESPMSNTLTLRTVPMVEPVPFVEAVSGLPRSVKVLWRPHEFERIGSYLVQRRSDGGKWKTVKELDGKLHVEYIDRGLDDGTKYAYRIIAKTYDDLETKPSQIVEATTKPLPVTVTGIKASTDLPRKIDLSWNPNPEKDIDHYNVYKKRLMGLLYTKEAEVKEPHFIDNIEKDGHENYYKVTAVDRDRLESLKQDEPTMGKTLPKPAKPIILNAFIQDNQAVIKWQEGGDGRSVSYILTKRYRSGISYKEQELDMGSNTEFVDVDIVPGRKYKYSLRAIDSLSIESEDTDEAVLFLPKRPEQSTAN
jgi:fibronectin type 3 domain-containing protein